MIKKIRILQVEFDTELKRYELPAFRAAIADKAGHEHVLFHNHINDNELRHRYPLIQYKSIAGNACVTCIEEGVDDIHHFFSKPEWTVRIGEEEKHLKIQKLQVNQFVMQVWDKHFRYNLKNWLALNSENFKRYQELPGIIERVQLLEQLLTANILSFAKGIGWTVEKNIELKITHVEREKIERHKGVKLSAFDLDFSTNVFIPNYIGLGKGAGFGFGTVKQIRIKEKSE